MRRPRRKRPTRSAITRSPLRTMPCSMASHSGCRERSRRAHSARSASIRRRPTSTRSLAAMADGELARKLADQLGKVPEASLALSLGLILKRPDFGPDPARVEIVRAIAKIQDAAAVTALTDYLDATPKNPPRPSR